MKASGADQLVNDSANPYRAPEVFSEPLRETEHRLSGWLRPSAALMCLTIGVGQVAAFVDIESIIFTGPAVSIIGLLVATAGHSSDIRPAVWLGLSGPAITALTALVINVMSWSPGEAQGPLPGLLCCYTAAFLPIGIYCVWYVQPPDRLAPRHQGFDDSADAVP